MRLTLPFPYRIQAEPQHRPFRTSTLLSLTDRLKVLYDNRVVTRYITPDNTVTIGGSQYHKYKGTQDEVTISVQ